MRHARTSRTTGPSSPGRNRVALLGLCALGVVLMLPHAAAAAYKEDFEMRVFAEAPDSYAKDHTLIKHTDGVYHLFYSVGHPGQGWNFPDNEIDIGHATSTSMKLRIPL